MAPCSPLDPGLVMKSYASAFILPNKSQDDISELGKDLMVDLFGGKPKDSLHYHHCAVSFSPRRWQLLKHLSALKDFPQLPQQQHSIAYVCITK